MPHLQRAQRRTLTYSQMYGQGDAAGIQEGRGIFSKLGKLIKRGAKTVGKFIKKTKLISRAAKIAAPLVAEFLPGRAGKIGTVGLSLAAELAKQQGFGLPRKIKALSRNQVEAILQGLAVTLKGGGVSLVRAKPLFPRIKNITATQMRALAALRGRNMKGGGVSLAGGRASRLPMSGMGFSGMGVRLAGQGVKLAGQGAHRVQLARVRGARRQVLKKKPRRRVVRRVF